MHYYLYIYIYIHTYIYIYTYIYVEYVDQKLNFFDYDKSELRLDFLSADLSQHFGIYLVVFTIKFFIHLHG